METVKSLALACNKKFMTYNKEETKQSVERIPMIEMELGDKGFKITKIC